MNRTRKIVAAGVGTAVVLAVVVMMLFVPNLHTQTPVSTAPPSNGGTGNGGNGGTGAGPGIGTGHGAGNTTASNCTASGDGQEWDDHNGTDVSDTAVRTLDDGNWTNETGDQDGGQCNASPGDHDWHGDQESDGHNGHEGTQDVGGMLTEDALALAPIVSTAISAASHAIVSLSGFLVGPLAGWASSAIVPSR